MLRLLTGFVVLLLAGASSASAEEIIERVAHTARRIIVPELNLGQLALEVERIVGRSKVRRVNRADGEMLTPQQILAAIEER